MEEACLQYVWSRYNHQLYLVYNRINSLVVQTAVPCMVFLFAAGDNWNHYLFKSFTDGTKEIYSNRNATNAGQRPLKMFIRISKEYAEIRKSEAADL
jgi:hypothetical protein